MVGHSFAGTEKLDIFGLVGVRQLHNFGRNFKEHTDNLLLMFFAYLEQQ
jgi:hypothetical protein